MAADIILAAGVEKALERILHAVGYARLDKAQRKVRSADGGAGVLCLQFVDVYHQPVACEHFDHFAVSLVAVAHDPIEHWRELGRVNIQVVCKHMHLPAVPAAAELHARNDLKTAPFALRLSRGNAVDAVVVGYGDSAQSERLCVPDGLLGSLRAVGYIRMNVKIYFSQLLIVSITFSASAYIFSGSSPMKNSPFSYKTLPFTIVRRTFSLLPE